MKTKVEIIKTIDINEDYAIIIVKKVKTETKKCSKCEHMIHYKKSGLGFCSKHNGVVSDEDTCIEEFM